MKRLVTILAFGAFTGCAGMDWNPDDNRVGYVDGTTDAPTTDTAFRDPVTGEDVAPDTQWQTTHEGKTYYFSSEESMRRFTEDPARFAEVR